MEDPRQETETLLRGLLQPYRGADYTPQVTAYEPPPACAGCGGSIPPSVLLQQPMATHCHDCRAGRR